jgi:serine protease
MMFYGWRTSPDRAPPRRMPVRLRPLIAALAAAAATLALPAVAHAGAPYRAGEVVVRFARTAGPAARAAAAHAAGVGSPSAFAPHSRVLRVRHDRSVAAAVRALRAQPAVVSATPNYLAHQSAFLPMDPGRSAAPYGWERLQWNFLSGAGVEAPDAWQHLIDAGRPGGRGVIVAVLDTGIAYADRGRYRRSPDFKSARFVRGYDFVDHDPWPNDENGHGTHVAGTVAETTGNDVGVTGLAYGARLMPVRVLDRLGMGDSATIAEGIRWAVDHGAKVINLSFEFNAAITGADIPEILSALRHARRRGVLVVGAAGNAADPVVAYPARSTLVLSVGATTEHECLASYSNDGSGLDLVAPGGGPDANLTDDPDCHPQGPPGRNVYQMTFVGSVRRFGLPGDYFGTSMAAPHVSATAALVIASGILGPDPSPQALTARLEATATDLGTHGRDADYGFGLVNAARATDPAIPAAPLR